MYLLHKGLKSYPFLKYLAQCIGRVHSPSIPSTLLKEFRLEFIFLS